MRLTKSKILDLYLGLDKNIEKFVQQIIALGVLKIGHGSYKLVYSKNKLSYVVKVANSLNDEFARLPSKLKNFYIKPYYIDENIVIQQRADTKQASKALKAIKRKLGEDSCHNYDIYKQNCGMLNGKPVVFDFAEVFSSQSFKPSRPTPTKAQLKSTHFFSESMNKKK